MRLQPFLLLFLTLSCPPRPLHSTPTPSPSFRSIFRLPSPTYPPDILPILFQLLLPSEFQAPPINPSPFSLAPQHLFFILVPLNISSLLPLCTSYLFSSTFSLPSYSPPSLPPPSLPSPYTFLFILQIGAPQSLFPPFFVPQFLYPLPPVLRDTPPLLFACSLQPIPPTYTTLPFIKFSPTPRLCGISPQVLVPFFFTHPYYFLYPFDSISTISPPSSPYCIASSDLPLPP